jgi:hypothetical protein
MKVYAKDSADGSGNVSIDFPSDVLGAAGIRPGLQLHACPIGDHGIWLSAEECPDTKELLALLAEVKRATREAHDAVNSALEK